MPRTKRAEIGLTYIYGIGRARSLSILMRAGIDPNKKVKDLNEDEVSKIRQIIEEEGGVEGDLRKEAAMNIRRLIEIGSYRGSGIGATCRSEASGRTPTPARARDRDGEPSPTRNGDGQDVIGRVRKRTEELWRKQHPKQARRKSSRRRKSGSSRSGLCISRRRSTTR